MNYTMQHIKLSNLNIKVQISLVLNTNFHIILGLTLQNTIIFRIRHFEYIFRDQIHVCQYMKQQQKVVF